MMKNLRFAIVLLLLCTAGMNAQFANIGMRGSATYVGWDGPMDIPLTTTDGVVYTVQNVTLFAGAVKFRENNEWPNNWGGTEFPSGVAIFDQGGVDIPCQPGVYNITFNLNTLEYNFEYQYVAMGVRGAATTVGWDGETDIRMNTTDGVIYTIDNLVLTEGGLKFRENNEWPNNWGGTDWPTGVAIFDQGGVDVPCQPGIYDVTFDKVALQYSFTEVFANIGIRGSATTVGWDGPDDIPMTTEDGIVYTLENITLTEGGLKFRENNDWPNNWGGTDWPAGVAIFDQGGVDIPCQSGTYDITFNLGTLEYAFEVAEINAAENFRSDNFSLYPNPAADVVTVSAGNNILVSVSVYDISGKEVAGLTPSNSALQLNVAALTPGIYFVKAVTQQGRQVLKFIKN